MSVTLFEQLLALLSSDEKRQFFVSLDLIKESGRKSLTNIISKVQTYFDAPPKESTLTEYLKESERKYNYTRNLLSDLTEILITFLMKQNSGESHTERWQQFLVVLATRNAPPDLYLKYWKKAKTANDKQPVSLRLLQQDFELKAHLYEVSSHIQDRRQGKSRIDKLLTNPLEEAILSLDNYYLVQRKKWTLEWNTIHSIKGVKGKKPPFAEFEVKGDPKSKERQILIERLDLVGKMYAERDSECFNILNKTLRNERFEDDELLEYCLILQSHCIREANDHSKGIEHKQLYLNEYLDLADFRAERNVLFISGMIPHPDLKNYITCCLLCKPALIGRAQQFLDHNLQYLEKTFAAEVQAFCQANIWYTEGKLDEAYHILWSQKFNDPYHKADARLLELKILYESERKGELDTVVENVIRFLYRSEKIPKERMEGYKWRVLFLKRIASLPPKNDEGIIRLREEIAEAEVVADREWLLEKLDELLENG